MKKILLIAIIVLSNLLLVNAEELPTIEVGSYTANINEEITIPVTIKNNSGFAFLGVKISYDADSLEYLSSKLIGLDGFPLKEITNNSNNKVVMYAISLNNDYIMKDDLKFAEIKFKIKDKAKDNELQLDVTDFGINTSEMLKYNAINGQIKIAQKITVGETIDEAKDKEIPNPNDFKWESSNPDVAIVDENGKVTFKKEGEVTITQKDKEDKTINSYNYQIDNTTKEKESKKDSKENNNLIIITSIISSIIILGIITFILVKHFKKSKNA